MTKAKLTKAYCPLLLRCNRLMEAFTKSDDERDFYLDCSEGFILYVDLDRSQEELDRLQSEIEAHEEHLTPIPKLSFYETKKIMEGFVNEKVYDIDTKEKLLDIIQNKEAREQFLEFIYDHESELEKWQQYYQERSRVRIIEWLREQGLHFVFEEDLELNVSTIETVKRSLFQPKVGKDIATARKALEAKAKTYYSSEALNPRPKRGRPPKQALKVEVEKPSSEDIYTTVTPVMRPFLFTPDITSASQVTFSAKYDNEEDLLASLRNQHRGGLDPRLESLNRKLENLRQMSTTRAFAPTMEPVLDLGAEDDDEDDDEDGDEDLDGEEFATVAPVKQSVAKAAPPKKKAPPKKAAPVKAKKPPVEGKKKTLRRLKPRRPKKK